MSKDNVIKVGGDRRSNYINFGAKVISTLKTSSIFFLK